MLTTTFADIDLKALYITDLLKIWSQHLMVKLQTLAAVGIRAEMQFLVCCVSLGISLLRMRILNLVLCTLHDCVYFQRTGSAAAAHLSCVRFESCVAIPLFVTSNSCDSSNLLLF